MTRSRTTYHNLEGHGKMKIKSKGNPVINGITLQIGEHNYPAIDNKDPLTALQLHAIREVGVIEFDELIDPNPAMEALDDPGQELVIESKKIYYETGKKAGRQKGIEYKGSSIKKPVAEKVEERYAGKSDKTAANPGKKNDKDKSKG